ncbi:MAG TPA: metal ABC transporter ATP-binding protein [Kiritimatiellia bacterium]|nr:metal ABC transporter ATP-binding protein [Kiritimatiellia bacterium]
MNDPAIHFRKLSVSLEGVSILQSVTATVPCGGCSAVVGPNGAGKTTLLLALLNQIPYQGEIHIASPPPRLGYVPQRMNFDRGTPITVMDFMVMGNQRRPLWLGTSQRLRNTALDLLASVHADTLATRRLGALSGGELQRVLLAAALQHQPELLILDEPAAGIDVRGEHLLCELLERLRRERGFTQLMVSHDLGTVSHHATHVILLNREVLAEGPPQDVLTPLHLAAAFGLHMGIAFSRFDGAPAACCGDPHA